MSERTMSWLTISVVLFVVLLAGCSDKLASPIEEPQRSAEAFVSVSAGEYHTCGVRGDGSVECWGAKEDPFGLPIEGAVPPSGAFAAVSAGFNYTCGVKTDGLIECWGSDGYGLATPLAGQFVSISVGFLHGCGVMTDGSVACWGRNNHGEAPLSLPGKKIQPPPPLHPPMNQRASQDPSTLSAPAFGTPAG